ncbi:MAG: hypothetical protein JXR88_00525 [Clostridia bacterium]|nr:hypothetical protein [Clostridia bacterium]
MYINMKKIYFLGVMMVIGFSLFFYGVINLVIQDHSKERISDEEIIIRARQLGMIKFEENQDKNINE